MKSLIKPQILAVFAIFSSILLFQHDAKFSYAKKAKAKNNYVQGKLVTGAIATGNGRVFAFDSAGKVFWQAKAAGNVHDVSILENGNVLIAAGKFAREINPKGKVIWEYIPKNQTGGGVFSVQRLKNGHTVVGENSTGRILEFNKKGKLIVTIQTDWKTKNKHHRMRLVRKLKNGKYLTCTSGDKIVRMYGKNGKVSKIIKGKNICFKAIVLKSGNILVSWLNKISEYDKDGKEVWTFKDNEIKGQVIRYMAGIQELANGNIVVGCYNSYNKKGQGWGAFEITKKKKVIWSYANSKADRSLMSVQKLTKKQLKILKKASKK